ncbi:MAG: hypothetical protein IKF31_06800 [Clostridiales bacterium]|nr:hypothetical protein [Clostridiales bacterium]
MKKFISIILAGSMLVGFSACNKKDSDKGSRDSRKDSDEVVQDEDSEETYFWDDPAYWEGQYYFIDVNDKAQMKKLVDGLITSEPKIGDYGEDIYKKISDSLGKEPSESGMFSNLHTFDFSYGSEIADYVKDRDRLVSIGYSNYETDDTDWLTTGCFVLGYEESYVNPTRPGIGDIEINIYDEERANIAYKNLCDCVDEIFAGSEGLTVEDSDFLGHQLKCGEGALNYYASVRMIHPEDIPYWTIGVTVCFADPDMMPVVEETESTLDVEATESEEEIDDTIPEDTTEE